MLNLMMVLKNQNEQLRRATHGVAGVVAVLIALCFSAPAARAQLGSCALSSPDFWNVAGNGNWSTGADWSGGEPGSSSNVCITNGTSTVTLDTNATIANLQLASGNALDFSSGKDLAVNGGSIVNDGNIAMSSGTLTLEHNLTLSGGGTLTMSGSADINTSCGGCFTLSNQSTIQGSGTIGTSGVPLNNTGGTIDANSSGNTLTLTGGGAITNGTGGLLEASAGGTLDINNNVNNADGNVTANGGTVTVDNITITGGTLNTMNSGVLQSGSTAGLNGITLSDGSTYTGGSGTRTDVQGTLTLGSSDATTSIQLAGTMRLVNNTTLAGPGSVTMAAGSDISTSCGGCFTLSNQTLIQGAGTIGTSSVPITNTGTIDANSGGNTLTLTGGSTISNAGGLLEATGGGTLDLNNNVNNGSGNITASGSGSVVIVDNITIHGGTLNTSLGGTMETVAGGAAGLDGNSGQGAILLSDGSTYTAPNGTRTDIAGLLNLGTSDTSTSIQLAGTMRLTQNTTLAGPGSVTMASGSDVSTSCGGCFTLTNEVLIQGAGTIGTSNVPITNTATIDADSSGGTLTLNGGGTITNASGLLEAASGGTLDMQNTVNNLNGNITADGGTVEVDNMTIQGGTLNILGGGTMETVGHSGLDGSSHGAITLSDGSTYTAGSGTTTDVAGTIDLGSSNAATTIQLGGTMRLTGNTTLAGPGSVTMTTQSSSDIATSCGGCFTLSNQTLIQGTGMIGTSNVPITNTGLIDANSSGNTLTMNGGGTITNASGLLEATGGGTLDMQNTVNNLNGNITADGGTVKVDSMTIEGGTLNTSGGGTMETVGHSGLDGSSHGAITLSDGSTYTAGGGTTTDVAGTMNLGTSNAATSMQLTGTLRLTGNTTLAGPGSVTMTSQASSDISTSCGGCFTLTNQATIQGAGSVGTSNLLLVNQGTIDANSSLNTLTLLGGGLVTNTTGTFEADSASKLLETNAFANYNGGTQTLAGGSYIANSGTIQINPFGNGGGEVHALGDGTLATAVTLNGTLALLADNTGLNALSLSTINAAASLTIENGYTLATPGDFSNAGTLTVGTAAGDLSTFRVGLLGTNTLTQSGGATQGTGTIAGNVRINGGTVQAGLPGTPGTLTITGTYDQTAGTLLAELGGPAAGTGYDQLVVDGVATLGGSSTLDVSLINGFVPFSDENFYIMVSPDPPIVGMFANLDLPGPGWSVSYNMNCPLLDNGCVDLVAPTAAATPEPAAVVLFGTALAMAALLGLRKLVSGS